MSNKKKKNSNYQTEKRAAASAAAAKKKKKLSKEAIVGIVCVAIIMITIALSITFCSLNNTKSKKYVKMTVEGHGDIILELDAKTAPTTVANFIKLVNDGFYDGLTFHRIIENFMIQGGDPKGNGTGGQLDENGKEINIKGEFSNNGHQNNISHKRGVISMARSGSPYNPSAYYNTASSQFFICNADSPQLDGDYAAFGWVIAGMDVVDSITEEGIKYTSDGVISDKSKQPVITSIVEISKKEAMKYVK